MSELSEFWYTEYTMSRAHGYDYTVFNLFDRTHITWLIVCLVFTVGISLLYRKSSEKVRRRLEISVAMFALFLEVSRMIEEAVTDQWHITSLPLQLCSISAIFCAWYGIHPNRLAGNLLYALSMPGAALALISPSWTMLPVWSFNHLNSAIAHIVIFSYPIMLIAGGKFKPELKELPKVLAILAAMCLIVTPINEGYNSNFFFIGYAYGNPISTICAGIFGEDYFVVGYAILLAIVEAGLYIPFEILRRRHSCPHSGTPTTP